MALLLLISLQAFFGLSFAVDCQFLPPLVPGDPSQQVGVIFIPGAYLQGETYEPVLTAILDAYPGSAWGGLTTNWLGDLPSPVQSPGAVQACLNKVSF